MSIFQFLIHLNVNSFFFYFFIYRNVKIVILSNVSLCQYSIVEILKKNYLINVIIKILIVEDVEYLKEIFLWEILIIENKKGYHWVLPW